jgi:hypothetical protein
MSRIAALFTTLLIAASGGCVGSSSVDSQDPVAQAVAADAAAERKVDALFAARLGRAPSGAERGFWAAELGKRSEEQVGEYARLVSQSIGEVYHRLPTVGELARFTSLLDRGVPL